MLFPTWPELIDGLGLFENHAGLGPFDSIQAATCVSRSAQLVSADRAYSEVPNLTHVVPGSPEFDALLQ